MRRKSKSINDPDHLHEIILNGLKAIQLEEFEGICLDKTLFNEAYYCSFVQNRDVIKLVIKTILSVFPFFEYRRNGSNVLMVTYDYQRMDHKAYWDSILSLFSKYDELFITDQAERKSVCLKTIVLRINKFIKFFQAIGFLRSFFIRLYLAAKILGQFNLLEGIKNDLQNYRLAMCLFDGGYYESILMSYLKTTSCITVTNQHGQPLFRNRYSDRMNQSQILNVISDYYFAKGIFTRTQLSKAGYDAAKVKIVGDLSFQRSTQYPFNNKRVFAVFLDCPTYAFAGDSNKIMIDVANRFANKSGLDYFIRTHPQDSPKYYSNFINNRCIGLFGKEKPLNEIFSEIDFGVFHASAIYLDLLKSGIRGFQVDCGIYFPLVTNLDDVIPGDEELEIRYNEWVSLDSAGREIGINSRMKEYIQYTGEEARHKYIEAVKSLL